jgi:DNA-binding protein
MVGRDLIYVGGKPKMNYVVAILTSFNEGLEEVMVRARGRAISNAVEIAERARIFFPDLRAKVRIGTDQISQKGGRGVSYIEITLKRAQGLEIN